MIDFSNTKLKNLIVHRVGNKSREEGTTLSNNTLKLQGEMLNDLMLQFFLSPFKHDNFYRFQHETDLELNETFAYTSKIFNDEELFLEQSQNIAKHLYEQSTHPKINSGEFYAIILENCLIEDELVNAVGLFKTENKDTYIKVKEKNESFEIDYENGININKLDKGCIIFNTEKDNGYIVSMVDNINKGGEAQYWKDNFLKIKPREDNYYFTQNYMNMCKDFADKGLEELEKTEQIDIKNNTMNYFVEKDTFNIEEFQEEVIKDEETKEVFKEFVQNYEAENEVNLQNEFDISSNAIKSVKRKFKSVIKLDKNFHIYVHGNQDMIEKGYDEQKNKNFYKLFFENEK